MPDDVISNGPIRVPGTYPPDWIPDQEADSCMNCRTLFTLIKRRHHCRSCGKIFCGDCCRLKAKLLYMDNKEARVCNDCYEIIEFTLSDGNTNINTEQTIPVDSSNKPSQSQGNNSTSSDHLSVKQVMFADGIRPGTDLSESGPVASSSSASDSLAGPLRSLLTRQHRKLEARNSNGHDDGTKQHNITVCDQLGYLPPIVISKDAPMHDKLKSSMESRSCPFNEIIKFEEISQSVGVQGIVTFILLKDYKLKVKIIDQLETLLGLDTKDEAQTYWSFLSDGLQKFGQDEVLLVIDKDKDDPCIPRDVFKIYLTLHELALRRQALEHLGNLLFQDGLFGNKNTAGLLLVKPPADCYLDNIIDVSSCVNSDEGSQKGILVALLLQRWEVPWSKVFPMRLLLRLGHEFNTYPYPIVSYRNRDPVYYEIGHTIISILGDFRNFRYSLTHVDGLKVTLNKATHKVIIQLPQSNYQEINKVLDNTNNEHVLAWSSSPFPESDGHLICVQNEDGRYETKEFYHSKALAKLNRDTGDLIENEDDTSDDINLNASFVVFSGALKVNQTGQPAKISIIEDGLLIQIQSCTMLALKNSIHFMDHFDINCENSQDPLNCVEIDWLSG